MDLLPEEIDRKNRELDEVNKELEEEKRQLEEMEMFKKVLEGQGAFKESRKEGERPVLFKPRIRDGKIELGIIIPISWLWKYLGELDGVDK